VQDEVENEKEKEDGVINMYWQKQFQATGFKCEPEPFCSGVPKPWPLAGSKIIQS
jgi:hypothetical protein